MEGADSNASANASASNSSAPALPFAYYPSSQHDGDVDRRRYLIAIAGAAMLLFALLVANAWLHQERKRVINTTATRSAPPSKRCNECCSHNEGGTMSGARASWSCGASAGAGAVAGAGGASSSALLWLGQLERDATDNDQDADRSPTQSCSPAVEVKLERARSEERDLRL